MRACQLFLETLDGGLHTVSDQGFRDPLPQPGIAAPNGMALWTSFSDLEQTGHSVGQPAANAHNPESLAMQELERREILRQLVEVPKNTEIFLENARVMQEHDGPSRELGTPALEAMFDRIIRV